MKFSNDVSMENENKDSREIVTTFMSDGQIQSSSAQTDVCTNKSEPIAIIGMACRLPGANTLEEFWELLLNGRDAMHPVSNDRWRNEQGCTTRPEDRVMNAGFLKCPVDEFDGKFFDMDKIDLNLCDPQQRLLLEVTWEALEDAAINPDTLKGTSTGIFTGTWRNDYYDLMLLNGYSGREFFRSYMGNSIGATAARLAHFLGVTGPNIATESGCSSSMVSVGLAIKSLRNHESKISLACGVNLLLNSFTFEDMQCVLSPDGHCKTFDKMANGYARAEGCGVLVLKRLSDALHDGDRINALILGYGEAQEGPSKSMGTPTVQCESMAMELALKDARLKPNQISYVEAHGTGTRVGDPLEIEAIRIAYSNGREQPLIIGTVKTNVGHTESCSGITGIIKTVLSLQNEIIPPHINITKVNKLIDLESIPAVIPLKTTPWKRNNQTRIAGVSSFGITGTNAHVILQEAPQLTETLKSSASFEILALSAKSEPALEFLLTKYEKYLQENPSVPLSDVTFTANAGRAHFRYRAALFGKTSSEILKNISTNCYDKNVVHDIPKIGFLFTGQGSQFHQMGQELYETSLIFREAFDACDKILTKRFNVDIRKHLFCTEPSEELNRTLYSQISIWVIEYCTVKVWKSWGIQPDLVLGHSLGEMAAATVTNVMSLEDGLTLVAERSRLIDNLQHGKMLVVRGDKQTVQQLLKKTNKPSGFYVDFAAFNSAEQTVVAGNNESIEAFANFLGTNKITAVVLNSTHAFHSRDMNKMIPEYRKVADSMTFSQPFCQFISGVDGKLIEQVKTIDSAYWMRHTRDSVKFIDACDAVHNSTKCRLFLEVGPQPILNIFLKINSEGKPEPILCLPSMRKNESQWQTMLTTLGKLYTLGFNVNWANVYRDRNVQKVRLPSYPFQRQKYWFEPLFKHLVSVEKKLHPLLGSELPNATKYKIFHNDIEISKEIYLSEHYVGNNIIFPAAGYLEICVASGYAIFSKNKDFNLPFTPILVENLFIHSPLELFQNKSTETQTMISNELNKSTVKIYSRQDETELNETKWIHHATATLMSNYLPCEHGSKDELQLVKSRLLEQEEKIIDFYSKALKLGLNLGPSFRSMKRVWKNSEEMLVEIAVPEKAENYFFHPVVIDAMFQALGSLMSSLDCLQLPISVGSFLTFAKTTTRTNYIHVFGTHSKTALLYDKNGKKLAQMTDFVFVNTTVQKLRQSLESQNFSLPLMFEEKWRRDTQKKDVVLDFDNKVGNETQVWIIFSNSLIFQTELATKLETQRYQVLNVVNSETYQNSNHKTIQIRFAEKGDFNLLLDVVLKRGNTSLSTTVKGVIFHCEVETELSCLDISNAFLNLTQFLISSLEESKLYVITEGVVAIGEQKMQRPDGATLWGMSKSLRSEHPDFFCRCIDIDHNPLTPQDMAKTVFKELFYEDKEHQVAYRHGMRHLLRLTEIQLQNKPLQYPNTERFSLVLPASKAISDLKFEPRPYHNTRILAETEIEVKVHACGLNFKDVLSVIKPTDDFINSNSLGVDFAGIVIRIGPNVTQIKVGDAVLGCNWHSMEFFSHKISWEGRVVKIPDSMTFADAATLSTAFSTAYYCLVTVANLKRGENVLIHTASGAVGLCAVQIANHIGAKIIATAGNTRKRTFLASLGLEYIFNSRDETFGEEINKITDGAGVQVVLNSLTGKKFKETSLKMCAKNARFVEMSALNIWNHQQVNELRPDVEYNIVDLCKISHETWCMLFQHLRKFLDNGYLKPIMSTRFDILNIREALTYLQKANHIGKVVCLMPQVTLLNNEMQIKSYLFNDRATYMITGGLGGIGLEVAKWMADYGAKYIMLCGRNTPNEHAQKIIDNLSSIGKCIEVLDADVGKYSDCLKLLQFIKTSHSKLPPLRGIMHAAGCINDTALVNQNSNTLKKVLNGKAIGAWNLHQLTLEYNLEHFVFFSSISSVLGSTGQSNYAAANAFIDSLAHYRHSLGLSATTVNWGQWGQVGLAADLELPGIFSISPLKALKSLELVLKSQRNQTIIVDGDVLLWKLKFPWAYNYFSELKAIPNTKEDHKRSQILSETFWIEMAETKDKVNVMQKFVSRIIFPISKLDNIEDLDVNRNLEDFGLDSIRKIELKNMLQDLFGEKAKVTMAAAMASNTVAQLSLQLLDLINGKLDKGKQREENIRLIREDCILPLEINPSSKSCLPPCINTSDIRSVLVTGGTGNLAPYIILNLCNRTYIDKVYCLVSYKSDLAGLERLKNNFAEKNILQDIKLEKLEIVVGNLAEPRLGMNASLYKKLALEVDAVIHCAVKSNHLEEYCKFKDNFTSLRDVNVGGTIRVLEFAAHIKTKWIFHASTFAVFRGTKTKQDGHLPESWLDPQDFDDAPNFGYSLSKFINEQLMHEGTIRGIPIKVFRFPIITGNSKDGRQNVAENHLFLRYICYLASGMMPNFLLPLAVMPVDVCADVSLSVFFADTDIAPSGVYNVSNPHNSTELDIIGLAAELGYLIKSVPYEIFLKKLKDDGKNSVLYSMSEFYTDEDRYQRVILENKVIEEWRKYPEEYCVSKKILKVIPHLKNIVEHPLTILKRDFTYAIKIGFLSKPK